MSITNSNLIKQPGTCCVYCGKSYKKKTNLTNHVNLCELIHKPKSSTTMEEEIDPPSNKKMYAILLELGKKYNQLEQKVDELSKWVVKKKQKINILNWLNTNYTPNTLFHELIDHIIVTPEDIHHLLSNPILETFNQIFSRNIYHHFENKYPIFTSIYNKINTFYIYISIKNESNEWVELKNEILIQFLNKVYMKLFRLWITFKKENCNQIQEDEKFAILCDKTGMKLMNIDFKKEATLDKIKSMLFTNMKIQIKSITEYEFETDS